MTNNRKRGIARYKVITIDGHGAMAADILGKWVKFEDAKLVLSALKELIAAIEENPLIVCEAMEQARAAI